jgi:hypothetical protein
MTTLNYFNRRNFLISLATLLVFAMGYMAVKTYKKPAEVKPMTFDQQIQKTQTQSNSDSVDSIEKDLNETDLNNVDSELQDIDKELETPE